MRVALRKLLAKRERDRRKVPKGGPICGSCLHHYQDHEPKRLGSRRRGHCRHEYGCDCGLFRSIRKGWKYRGPHLVARKRGNQRKVAILWRLL